MEQKLLDLDFLFDLSANDAGYIYDVINLFLDVVPPGISKLDQLINETNDFEAIHRQAHFLKSSAAIIKIRGVYDDLTVIVSLAREAAHKPEIVARMAHIRANFNEALPLVLAEKEKYAQTTR